MRFLTLLPFVALLAAPAHAGDPAAGERQWRQCQACHVIVDNAGNQIQGVGRQGPNLYGVIGRQAGSVDGFRYSEDLAAAGAAGLVWDEASFVAYVTNPTGFLRDFLNKPSARGAMAWQMRQNQADMFAYLESVVSQ